MENLDNEKLTSFKVNEKIHDAFKIEGIKYKITLKKLAERAMFLFIKDDDFRKKILNTMNLEM